MGQKGSGSEVISQRNCGLLWLLFERAMLTLLEGSTAFSHAELFVRKPSFSRGRGLVWIEVFYEGNRKAS